MKKVIFDTDLGIDDAMALLFLHCSSEVDLKAIITGFGNASLKNTTRNTLYMKALFGIGAPIYQGADRPYNIDTSENFIGEFPDFVHGKNGLGDIDFPEPTNKPETKSGAQAIVDLVKANPHEISIVAVGRMTNIAHALALFPDLPKLTKELIVMGGAFGFNNHHGNVSDVAEANIWGDPAAADIVFKSGFALTIVGLDVTMETIADALFFDTLRDKASSAGEFIYNISRYYLNFHLDTLGKFQCPVHDSSAVAYLLKPQLYTVKKAVVEVIQSGVNIGQTVFSEPELATTTPSCQICTKVQSKAVLELYTTTLING